MNYLYYSTILEVVEKLVMILREIRIIKKNIYCVRKNKIITMHAEKNKGNNRTLFRVIYHKC